MTREFKYLFAFLLIFVLLRLGLEFPHREIQVPSFLNVALQLLLFLMCVDIGVHSYKAQRHVYFLFSLFFFFSLFLFASSFVGKQFLTDSRYSPVYYHVYANKFGLNVLFLLAITFSIMDYFFSRRPVSLKYAASIAVTLVIVLPLFWPFLENPLQLYYEKEYVTLQRIREATAAAEQQHLQPPTDREMALRILGADPASHPDPVELRHAEASIVDLRPYANDGGSGIIFWKPLNMRSMYVQFIIIALLGLFLVVNYSFNKPHGAYLDKILFLMLLLSPMEIVHLLAYTSSSTLAVYQDVFSVAQYATIVCLLMMVYTFDLRLRFVLSPTGMYYEETVSASPEKVTRWRDELDNLILKIFVRRRYDRQLGHTNDVRQTTQ